MFGPKSLTSKGLGRPASTAERRLWAYLRDEALSGRKFRRQTMIRGHIVAFACFSPRLVIDIELPAIAGSAMDAAVRAKLETDGFKILRFRENEVLRDVDAVVQVIERTLRALMRD